MPQMFGPHGPLDTTHEAYLDGYQTGKTWIDEYRPGGPFICQSGYSLKEDTCWESYCAATVLNNSEWQRGFKDGRKTQVGGKINGSTCYWFVGIL